ncbi:MAG: hypothetical protein WBE72_19295 [Terracidiphilus sp.]
MTFDPLSAIERREFLKLAGATAVCAFAPTAAANPSSRVAVLMDASHPVASSRPVLRAAEQLKNALALKNVQCAFIASPHQAAGFASCVVVADPVSNLARAFPPGGAAPAGPESIRMAPGRVADAPAILVSAIGPLGFVYGLLELAERVQFNADPIAALRLPEAIGENPANPVRCVSRYFCCEIEDKPWYRDRNFWPAYLDVLAASRFNRFCLAFGLAYDFPKGVTDDYLHLPYPYLVDVPGYSKVQVVQLRSPEGTPLPALVPLSAEERNLNFEMLKFIAAETAARGLHFQLGIWTHAYQWTDSPNAYHRIGGLTPETHAAYCRDALAILLRECPQIQGITLRVHGESGIPEGSYSFWKTLFQAIAGAGRGIEIDMHAKGVDQTMIDIAVATGMNVKLGAKYSAEHQSLGYNQADIRALEIPDPNRRGDSRLFSLSSGSRLFTRYGYADFLQQGSRAQLLFRLWPGTQRHLLSADPEMAAAYGRTAHFCGAAGIDLMEPLTFKGREGSGHSSGRCAYAHPSLDPDADWKKFEYYYRVWGRKLYHPESDPESTRRSLRNFAGPGAASIETALANSSRILPLITSAHLPSASNHAFWPELYTNMPIAPGSAPSPYSDTPQPKCFATVSPLDPQLFSTVVEHTRDLVAGRPNPKYSPIEVAQWLEDFVAASTAALAKARAEATSSTSPEFRRMEEDILIQNGLGAFFAARLRSAILYQIFLETGNRQAGNLGLALYRKARQAWAAMAARAATVYVSDISYGSVPMRRGHWSDRLAAIDTDVAVMQEKVQSPPVANGSAPTVDQAIAAATGKPARPFVRCTHAAPETFCPGKALTLSLQVSGAAASVRLHYRHVDQAERWLSAEMQSGNGSYTAAIPAGYTQSPYPLQYYFELASGNNSATLFPGFNATLSSQPYYAVYKRSV